MIQFQRFKQSDPFYPVFYIFNNLICFILPSVCLSIRQIYLSIYLSTNLYLSIYQEPTFGTTTSKEKLVRLKSWIQYTFIIISDTILICLTSCFVLFCLPSIRSLLSIYHSLSIYLFVCLSVLSNLHFGIDFGRNDPGPKQPRAEH